MTPVGLEWGGGAGAAVFAAAVAAALFWHLARARGPRSLKALRAAAAAGLIIALLKPALTLRSPLRVKPKLAILIDDGHSMGGSAGKGVTRLRQAQAFLKRNRALIEERADPVFFAVSGQGRRLSGWDQALALLPSASAFHASDALSDVASDPASVGAARYWLLSDGSAEPDPQLGRALADLKAPLDALAVGPKRRGRSLSFSEVRPPDFAFLHGSFSVSTTLEGYGLAGRTVHVKLSREVNGQPGVWEPVQEADARFNADFDAWHATWTAIASSLGTERYRLSAGAPGVASVSRAFRVEIVRQKYRIMYLSGRPSPEYAFLRQFLKSNPNHELVSFVILRNPDNPTLVPDDELSLIPFPAEQIFVQDLGQFDLFILENFSYARFRLPVSYLASLRDFVARGGALLVIGGENSFDLGGYRGTPLEEMLPVTLAAGASPDYVPGLFRAKPSAPGHPLVDLYETPDESRKAWEALPELEGFARFGSVRPSATVLAVNPGQKTESGQPLPVAAIRDFGRGKVMLLGTDSTWRWRLGAAQDWRTSSFYARFWSRVVRYLTGTLDLSKVKFAPLPDRLPPREPATFSLRVFDEGFRPVERSAAQVTVLWTPPGKPAREVPAVETEPGVFSIELTGLAAGVHRLRATARYHGRVWGQDEVRFVWEGSQEEPVDRPWLKAASDQTGGTFQDASGADAAALLSRLPPPRVEAQVRRRAEPWQSAPWLWLTAGLFVAEWGLRRRRGLP